MRMFHSPRCLFVSQGQQQCLQMRNSTSLVSLLICPLICVSHVSLHVSICLYMSPSMWQFCTCEIRRRRSRCLCVLYVSLYESLLYVSLHITLHVSLQVICKDACVNTHLCKSVRTCVLVCVLICVLISQPICVLIFPHMLPLVPSAGGFSYGNMLRSVEGFNGLSWKREVFHI